MKDNTTTKAKHKTTITAHIEMILMISALVAASFAIGYFFAAAQIAATLKTN